MYTQACIKQIQRPARHLQSWSSGTRTPVNYRQRQAHTRAFRQIKNKNTHKAHPYFHISTLSCRHWYDDDSSFHFTVNLHPSKAFVDKAEEKNSVYCTPCARTPFWTFHLFQVQQHPLQNEQLLHSCVKASLFYFLAHFKAICLLCCLLTLSVVIKGALWNLWFNYTGLVMQRGPG